MTATMQVYTSDIRLADRLVNSTGAVLTVVGIETPMLFGYRRFAVRDETGAVSYLAASTPNGLWPVLPR